MNPGLHCLKSFWLLLLSLPLAGLLAACGGGSDATTASSTPSTSATSTVTADPVTKTAILTGDQQVPAVTTAATGSASFTLDRASGALSGSVKLDGVTATSVHIHDGAAGINGGVVVNLNETAASTWSVPANTVLTATQIASFNNGALYVNAHSSAQPAGELRGQIGMEVYSASASGKHNTPATASTATGTGSVVLDPATKALSGSLTLSGMTATMVHIHTGAVGVNGDVVVNLTESPAGSGKWAIPANTVLTDAQLASLRAGELYFNAHSAAFPAGEIRGQIGRNVKTATLNGGHQVPSTSSTATGTGFLSVDPATRAVTGSISLSGMTATMGHVHQGAFGQNGGVVINLVQSTSNGNTWTVPANTTLSASQYLDFLNNSLYFNAHSDSFPAGEVRGQIDDDTHHH